MEVREDLGDKPGQPKKLGWSTMTTQTQWKAGEKQWTP